MILHPGIIGLIIAGLCIVFMVLFAAVTGLGILAKWDFSSSSENQLRLERRTYLVSTLLNWALSFQVLSAILFVYTMDDIHELFVGAMCATGSLNANPIGWYALLVKVAALFFSAFWLALNYVDQRLEEYPYVRFKYILLIALLPLIVMDLVLQLIYFMGLEPAIITSCCGSLFGSDSVVAMASVTAVPVKLAMVLFYSCAVIYVSLCLSLLRVSSGALRYLTTVVGGLFLYIAIVSIISFVSIYIYELPTHHCPFDILQGWYNYIGYPIYIVLFLSVYLGMLPGIFQLLKQSAEVKLVIAGMEKRWLYWSIGATLILVTIITYSVVSSNLVFF